MILVVGSEKGGVGKTTLAVNLAVRRAQAGCDVLLVDADPQMSASEAMAEREASGRQPALTCVSIPRKEIKQEVRRLAPRFDDVVIDVGGRDTFVFRAALVVADVLVMPILPGQLDCWAAEGVDELVGEARAVNEGLRAVALINKMDTNPRVALSREVVEFAQGLEHIALLRSRCRYRVAWRQAVAEGMSVSELEVTSKAALELEMLYREIYEEVAI